MIRLYVIDDHSFTANGLRNMYRPSRDGIDVTGDALKLSEALCNARSDDFDIIILDLWLGDADPVDNVNKLQKSFPGKHIVVLTYEESPFWIHTMFNEGVKAYILKNVGKKKLRSTLEEVANGLTVYPDFYLHNSGVPPNPPETIPKIILKPSEKEIFQLMVKGNSQEDIAKMQNKTTSAIEKVIRKVKKQLNVKSISEIIHLLTVLKEI